MWKESSIVNILPVRPQEAPSVFCGELGNHSLHQVLGTHLVLAGVTSKLRNIVAKQRAQVPIAAAGHWQTWTQRCAQFWQSAHLLHADAGGSIHWGLLRFTQSQPGSLIAHVCRSADLEQPSSLSDRDSTA